MAFFGLFSRDKKETLNKGLEKTKKSFFSKIARSIVGKSKVDADVLDNLEEIFENREQIEISKFYEKLPKPVSIAMDQFMNDEVYIRKPEQKD